MYRKILVPLDGSPLAECVLAHVEELARDRAQEVVFVRVVKPFAQPAGADFVLNEKDMAEIEGRARATAEDYLRQIAAGVRLGSTQVRWEILNRDWVAESIAEYAARNGIDLIVIATHGRSGVSRWVWGSVADRILRSSSVPILMIRAPGCLPGA